MKHAVLPNKKDVGERISLVLRTIKTIMPKEAVQKKIDSSLVQKNKTAQKKLEEKALKIKTIPMKKSKTIKYPKIIKLNKIEKK